MHNYIPLVISRNDKNKRLTLLSQHKLALTGGIHFLEHLKNKKMALSSIYHTCHQKQNPSRETVHLIRHVDLVWCTYVATAFPNKLVDLWSGGGLNADAGEGQLEIVGGTGWAQLREGQIVHTKVLIIRKIWVKASLR
jgi:hypothetical protein